MRDALLTAEKLLQVGAVKLSVDEPYTWASGWKSPIYCDNRKVLSHPYVRDYIKSELCNVVWSQFGSAGVIAGVASAGIPWSAMVADQLKLPLVYVRPAPKAHGLGNQIEGELPRGAQVVVIEDLVSTGGSSLKVVDALKHAGSTVVGLVSIFDYGFPATDAAFGAAGLDRHSLTNYAALLECSQREGIISPDLLQILLKWREDPANWRLNA
jgi:orotate phosphoribosyltransferase